MALSAGAQSYQLRPYTIEDGLPQSQVYDLIQDASGYLWLGTQGGGVARFDGKNFDVFNENNGLLSNYIQALEAKEDSLFIGTKRGLSIKCKGGFKNFPSPSINALFLWQDQLYVGTQFGVYRYTQKEGLSQLKLDSELDRSSINEIAFDGKSFWLATNKGVWQLSKLKEEAQKQRRNDLNTTSIVAQEGRVFLASFMEGIFVFEPKTNDFIKIIDSPIRINSISIQQEHELWVATDNDGILIYDSESNELIKQLDAKGGLGVPHIRTVTRDNQENIWIATSGGGFYKYFQNNFNHFDRDTGLKGNRVYAVHSTRDTVWFSASEAGLSYMDSLGIHPLPRIPGFSNVKIKTIDSDGKGRIWAGSDGKGILLRRTISVDSLVTVSVDSLGFTRDTLKQREFTYQLFKKEDGLPSNWIRKIVCVDDYVWVATYSDGLVKLHYNSTRDSLEVLQQVGFQEGLNDLLIKDIVMGPNGRLWYATQNGIIGKVDGSIVKSLGLVLDQEVAIGTLLFHQDKLFIGTAGKGVWYTSVDDSFRFRKLKGAGELTSENVYQLQFDNEENLWVGSEKGVDKIRLNASGEIEELIHFGRNDGFLAIETCLNAVAKDDKGNLWFGGIYGLTQYTPGEKAEMTHQPIIRFESLEIDYEILDSIDPNSWSHSNNVLQLKPEQNQLAFTYRTVDINHPAEIYYRTRLNDRDWGPWSKEGRQNLVGLAYGSHSFMVQSRNYQMMESEPLRFQFFIETPLHKKVWFQWMLFGVFLTVLTGGVLLYVRRIKARNKANQEQLQLQNYLLTLEQKALRLQMNPHFIFNVLNGIKAMAVSNPKKMNETINHFALLLRENLYNSRKDTIGLDQELKSLKHYIEVELLMTPKPFSYTLSVDSNIHPEEVLIPPMLVQPFVENAIRHGILKGPRKGKLAILFYTEGDFLCCKIEDNGLGIYESQKNKMATDHQSMALEVTRERLESLSDKGALQIKELKTETNEVVGTQIVLRLPLLTDY